MAEKIKMGKQSAPPLPVSVEKKKQARAAPPFPAVGLVSLWALCNAAVPALAVAFSCTLSAYNAYSQLPSSLLQHVELTDAEHAKGSALILGYIWCSVPQAAAATLALLLADHRRRIRRALAYLALTGAVAGHCMFASVLGIILAADLGYLFMWIGGTAAIFFCAAGDLLGFLALLCGGEE